MPIIFSEPPPRVTEALRRGVAALQKPPGVSLLRAPSGPDVTWSEPHAVYHLGLDDVRANRGLGAARSVSWRYLKDGTTAATVAADADPAAEEHLFGGLQQGPFVRGFSDELRRTSADPALRWKTFEPRLLQIPALYVVALWLHEPASAGDVFVPLAPVNPALQPGRRYTRREFEAALASAADNVQRPPADERGERGTQAP